MPYPTQFPYDFLDALPDDDAPTLRKHWGEAMKKRRAQRAEVGKAFQELLDATTRLKYDILLITDVAAPADVSALIARLERPVSLPERAEPPPITLLFTALAGDPSEHDRPPRARSMPITASKRFAELPADVPGVAFDR